MLRAAPAAFDHVVLHPIPNPPTPDEGERGYMARVAREVLPRRAGGARREVGGAMLFMVVERFKNRDAKAVYRRFREQGRGAPDGLTYVGSWIEANFDRCFQLMECDDARRLQQWVAFWSDLIEFEIVPVVPSAETRESIEPML